MLRVVTLLAAALGAEPAQAQTAEAVDAAKQAVAQIQHDGVPGPIAVLALLACAAVVVVLGLVIKALWNAIKERDAVIAALQEKRVAEQVESTKQVASTAISGAASITASSDRMADVSSRIAIMAERLLPIPEMVGDIKSRIGEVARSCGRGAP